MVSVHPFRGWTVSLSAAFLLAAPALSGVISDRHLSGNAATLALALTPVVVAVATAASGAEAELAGLLWPGLAGLAGLLLLLPQPSLSSWRMDLGLVGMPLFAGLTATYLGIFKPNVPTGERDGARNSFVWIEYGLLFAALLFGLTMLPGLRQGSISFSWAACGADGLLSALTLWLLERVGAVRWSAQFLLGPLLTILEGVVLLRPTLTARSWVGLLLMAIGGGYLLVPRPEEG